LQNSDLTKASKFACPLIAIAHLGHEGIAGSGKKLAQERLIAFSTASSDAGPLQNQIGNSSDKP
jgi:hypothetical protein